MERGCKMALRVPLEHDRQEYLAIMMAMNRADRALQILGPIARTWVRSLDVRRRAAAMRVDMVHLWESHNAMRERLKAIVRAKGFGHLLEERYGKCD